MSTTHEIMMLPIAWSEGDLESLNQLSQLVEAELRHLTGGYLAKERPGHILQAAALVHEAYLRSIDWRDAQWQNCVHSFGPAPRTTRRIRGDLFDLTVFLPSSAQCGLALSLSGVALDAASLSMRLLGKTFLNHVMPHISFFNSRLHFDQTPSNLCPLPLS